MDYKFQVSFNKYYFKKPKHWYFHNSWVAYRLNLEFLASISSLLTIKTRLWADAYQKNLTEKSGLEIWSSCFNSWVSQGKTFNTFRFFQMKPKILQKK